MPIPLRVLHVEDSQEDAELLEFDLRRAGYDPYIERVDTPSVMKDRLMEGRWDIVISDYAMPKFDGMEALEVYKSSGLDIPFILMSGVIGEDVAIDAMVRGAHDYVMKDKRTRLIPAIERELREASERKARRDAEEALRQSEEKYRTIFENAIEGIFQSTPDGHYVKVNPALARMFGYGSPEEMMTGVTDIGHQIYVDPEDRVRFQRLIEEQGLVEGFQAEERRRDGDKIWVSVNAHTVRDGSGAILYYEGTMEDITAQKRNEQALKESEERYRTVIEHSNEGIALLKGNKFIYVNKRFLDIHGYSNPEEIIGKSNSTMLHPDDLQRIRDINRRRKANEPVPESYECRGIKKDGSLVHLEVSATGVVYQGEPVRLVFTRDVSERKALEEQFRQSQKLEAIGQLAGGVAHDFNNILTVITGFGSILKMNMKEGDPSMGYVDQMLASAEKAANLTRSLLAFGRKQIISPKPSDINTIIRRMKSFLSRLIGEDIELKTMLSPGEIVAMVDENQIDQVIMNIAANARDAMPHGGTLLISTRKAKIDNKFIKANGFGEAGSYALISISDTGTGMDEETKEKIFEPFFTTKEVGKGTGLGLSTVYGIVKQHNGHVLVESEPDKGTTFNIYLPLIRFEETMKTHEPSPDIAGGNETILLVEDEENVRGYIKAVLEHFGYKIVEAVDGADAIKQFGEYKDTIDLCVIDVVMPRMNGKELYDRLSKVKPHLKALFISGYTNDILIQKGVSGIETDLISKPIKPADLLAKVREVLEK